MYYTTDRSTPTWALEVGDVKRFSSIKKAISYCGLCGAEKSSANTVQRTPLSKQRNKHLQTTLIETAKMAPRNSSELAVLYDQEKQKGYIPFSYGVAVNIASQELGNSLNSSLLTAEKGSLVTAPTARSWLCQSVSFLLFLPTRN